MLATRLASLLPEWIQPYVSVLPFQARAMFQTDERNLMLARSYLWCVAVALLNRTRRSLAQKVGIQVPDEYALGMPAKGSLIHMLA